MIYYGNVKLLVTVYRYVLSFPGFVVEVILSAQVGLVILVINNNKMLGPVILIFSASHLNIFNFLGVQHQSRSGQAWHLN